jgi:hypothetical protein
MHLAGLARAEEMYRCRNASTHRAATALAYDRANSLGDATDVPVLALAASHRAE